MMKAKEESFNIDAENIEDIEEELSRTVTDTNESKELFSNKDIKAKTELSDDEIIYATKLKYMREQYNLPIYDKILNEFFELRLSKKRKSRAEYIDSMKQKVKDFFSFGGGGGQNELRR